MQDSSYKACDTHRRLPDLHNGGTEGAHYKVMEVGETGYHCLPLDTDAYSTANIGLPQLNWAMCGDFRMERGEIIQRGAYTVIRRDQVAGKILSTGNFAVEMPAHWLMRY